MFSCSRSHVFMLKCQAYFKSTGGEEASSEAAQRMPVRQVVPQQHPRNPKDHLWYWTQNRRRLLPASSLNGSTITENNSLRKTSSYQIETPSHISLSSWVTKVSNAFTQYSVLITAAYHDFIHIALQRLAWAIRPYSTTLQKAQDEVKNKKTLTKKHTYCD